MVPRILVVAAVVVAGAAGAQGAQSAERKTCALRAIDQYPPTGKPEYNTSLKALGTSCPTAVKVMRGYHACRAKSSVRCTRKVLRVWTCTGKVGSRNPVTKDFDATYTCRYGARRVTGSYQQNR